MISTLRLLLVLFAGVLCRLLLASAVVFVLSVALSGDAATVQADLSANPDYVRTLQEQWQLNQSILERYGHWLFGLLRADLGISLAWNVPVGELVAQRLPVTLALAGLTTVLLVLCAVPLALALLPRIQTRLGALISGVIQMFAVLPPFVLGLVLILIFAIGLDITPSGGFDHSMTVQEGLRALLLPLMTLALPQIALLVRFLVSAMLDVEQQPFSRAARARGYTRAQNRLHTDLRHSLAPSFAVLSLQVLYLISGTVIVETLFRLNGLGQLLLQLVSRRDEEAIASVAIVLILLAMSLQFLCTLAVTAVSKTYRMR